MKENPFDLHKTDLQLAIHKWCEATREASKAKASAADLVNSPAHYTKGGIEPWDFIASQNLNFLAGNVVKYISRYRYKNGVEDLKKAKTYLEKLITIEEQSK